MNMEYLFIENLFDFLHQSFLVFLFKFCTYFVRFIPKNCSGANVTGILFLISNSNYLLEFCMLVLYPPSLL